MDMHMNSVKGWQLWVAIMVLALGGCTSSTFESGNQAEASAINWIAYGPVEWALENGEYSAAGEYPAAGFLVSEKMYRDFTFSVDFWIDADTNSGVFLRCSSPEMVSPITCYEANIWDDHTNQESRTGSLVLITPPLVRVDTVGKWNTMTVTARGPEISVTINDQLTAIVHDEKHAEGYLALQYGGKQGVRFKNLKFQESAIGN